MTSDGMVVLPDCGGHFLCGIFDIPDPDLSYNYSEDSHGGIGGI